MVLDRVAVQRVCVQQGRTQRRILSGLPRHSQTTAVSQRDTPQELSSRKGLGLRENTEQRITGHPKRLRQTYDMAALETARGLFLQRNQ